MKVAITGHEGMIGSRLVSKGCIPLVCDITKPYDTHGAIFVAEPDVVIHCAALTDVAYCETHFKEAFEVNVRGTSNVVDAMPKGSTFIYLSSDHLFNGNQWFNGYGEWQKPSPINYYGYTKWGGELAAKSDKCRTIIVRSSKLFYYEWCRPTIEKLKNGEDVVFTDIIKRSFYHANHFVEALLFLVHHLDEYPDLDIINISGGDVMTYYLFWHALKEYLELPGKIVPRNSELKDETPRPYRAGLDIKLSKKIGLPTFSLKDGFELIRQGL